jgi:hypothetical protein
MRTIVVALSVALLAASTLSAVPAGVVYTEGAASVRFKSGSERDAAIGDTLNTGDTVRTGADGLVELDQKGVRLDIASDTVFTLMEREKGGRTAGVFSVALGSVKFRYDRLTGQEPLIQTNSCIAGVRGTEFSVFAGVDGSALIVVDKGTVTVEAEGRSVALEPEEGVEVRPGQPPGDKFRIPKEKIDYRKWNEDKLTSLLGDPVAAIQSTIDQLRFYTSQSDAFGKLYDEYRSKLQSEEQKRLKIAQEQGVEIARKYENETVFPLRVQTGNLFLNVRYYSLAALSLRRYVGGRMYMLLKIKHITSPTDETYTQFLSLFRQLLSEYEDNIVPLLVETDI